MDDSIRLKVNRRFDNRQRNLPDDSPLALELHRLRAAALHDALDSSPYWTVRSWGETDDTEAHEVVDVVLWAVQHPDLVAAVSTAAAAVGKLLLEAGVGAIATKAVEQLYDRLRGKQAENKITHVLVQPTVNVSVQIDPPSQGGRAYVNVQVDGEPF